MAYQNTYPPRPLPTTATTTTTTSYPPGIGSHNGQPSNAPLPHQLPLQQLQQQPHQQQQFYPNPYPPSAAPSSAYGQSAHGPEGQMNPGLGPRQQYPPGQNQNQNGANAAGGALMQPRTTAPDDPFKKPYLPPQSQSQSQQYSNGRLLLPCSERAFRSIMCPCLLLSACLSSISPQ